MRVRAQQTNGGVPPALRNHRCSTSCDARTAAAASAGNTAFGDLDSKQPLDLALMCWSPGEFIADRTREVGALLTTNQATPP